MTKKTNLIVVSGIVGLALLTGIATFASTTTSNNTQTRPLMGLMGDHAMGKGGKGMGGRMGMGSGNTVKMQNIQTAIQNNDYSAYKKAYTDAMMTKSEFTERVQMHQNREAIQAAVQKGDYAAFTAAIKGTPMEGKVTQEQFATMGQGRKAMGQKGTQ